MILNQKKVPKRKFTLNQTFLLIEALFFIWFIFAFLIFPNFTLFKNIIFSGDFVNNVQKIFESARAKKAIVNSFILAFSLCITVNIVGTLIVLITEYFDIKGAKILRIGYMSTMIYGGMILVSGYRFLYGEGGYFTTLLQSIFPNVASNWFEGYGAVLFVMTFACTTNHAIFLRNALHQVDYQTIEAARSMGASNTKILFKVVLPTLLPSYLSITILTFIKGLCAMAAPLLIGGTEFQTINPMIITFVKMDHTRNLGAVMAIFLGLITFVLLMFMNHMERKGHYMSISKVKTTIQKQKINSPVLNVIMHILAYFMFLIYVAPVCMIILFSFTDAATIASRHFTFSSFTLKNYINVFTNPENYKPLLTSMILGAVSVTLVIVLVLFACRIIVKHKRSRLARGLEYGLLIPWLLPAILISVGLLQTYNVPQWPVFGITLGGTALLLIIAYVINKIPYTLRMTKAAFYSIDDSLEDAAKNMGAKNIYTFVRVLLPIIMPTVLAIWALEFNGTLGEYDISVLLSPTTITTLGVTIKTLTTDTFDPNSAAVSFVYAVIMMIISGLVCYFVYGRKSANHHTRQTKRMIKKLKRLEEK